jgi:hypothetical protein
MNLRHLLLLIMRTVQTLTPQAKPVALRTVIIILLSVDQRAENDDENQDRHSTLIEIFDVNDSEADRRFAIDLVQSFGKILEQENYQSQEG